MGHFKCMYIHVYCILYLYVYFSEDHSSSTGQSSETGEGVTAQDGGGHGGQLLMSQVQLSNCYIHVWNGKVLN